MSYSFGIWGDVTTIVLPSTATHVDLQNSINHALYELEEVTEAKIILQCPEIIIQPDYSSQTPYQHYSSITINIGASNLVKLSIIGASAENHTLVTLTEATSGVVPEAIFKVIGSIDEDKEVSFQYLTMQYSGTYVGRKGIKIQRGLNKLLVKSCMFSHLGWGVYQESSYYTSTVVRNLTLDSNDFYEPSGVDGGQNYQPFYIDYTGSSSITPIDARISILNNTIRGFPKNWGYIRFAYDDSFDDDDNVELNIQGNHFGDSGSIGSYSAKLEVCDSSTSSTPAQVNLLIKENRFINGYVSIHNLSGVITSNKFYTDANRNLLSQITLTTNNHPQNMTIFSNEFYGSCQFAIDLLAHSNLSDEAYMSVAINQNSFLHSGGVIKIFTNQGYNDGSLIVTSFKNNLVACNSAPFIIYHVGVQMNHHVEVTN